MKLVTSRTFKVLSTVVGRRPLLLALGLATVISGVAVASWSISGSGTAYTKAATASSLTLGDASASVTADLYPGANGDVKLRVTNPTGFPVRLTSVTRTGAITSDKGVSCNASTGVTFADQTGLALDLAAGATSTFTLAGVASMSNASDNACQGAIFSIPISVQAVSNA